MMMKRIFIIIVCILMCISLFKLLINGDNLNYAPLSFKSFLDYCAEIPVPDISWSYVDLSIYIDWGSFNFIRDFINMITSIFEFLVFLCGLLWQFINVVFYILKSFFDLSISIIPGSGPGGRGPSFGFR